MKRTLALNTRDGGLVFVYWGLAHFCQNLFILKIVVSEWQYLGYAPVNQPDGEATDFSFGKTTNPTKTLSGVVY